MNLNASSGGATPVIYLGQSSQAVAIEMDKICTFLGGMAGPSATCVVDEIATKGNQEKTTRLLKCAHTLTERTEFCSVCSQNAEHLQDVIQTFLEEQSSYANQVCVVADSYTQFGAWSAAIVREYLQQETSVNKGSSTQYDSTGHSGGGGAIISVLMKPPLGCCRGLECLYSLLSAQHALDSSHAVLFRGNESHHNDQSTTSSSMNTASAIACDLYQILASSDATTTAAAGYTTNSTSKKHTSCYSQSRNLHSYLTSDTAAGDMQYHLWPLDVCRAQHKIIDARSSLSALLKKLLKTTSGSTKGVEYNPLRSVSSNVHHLHLSYSELYNSTPHSGNESRMCVSAANYAALTLPATALTKSGTRYKALLFRDVPHTEHDIAVALSWATPGTTWPYRNSNKSHTGGGNGVMSMDNGADNDSYSASVCGSVGGNSMYTDNTPFAHMQDASGCDTSSTKRGKKGAHTHVVYPLNAINTGTRASAEDTGADDEVSVFTMGSTASAGSARTRGAGGTRGVAIVSDAQSRLGSGHSTYSVGSSGSRMGSAYSTASNISSSGVGAAGQLDGASQEHSIGCLVFGSPYGVQDCRHICASSKQLLSIGAYRHLFGPQGSAFTADELLDAVDVVESCYLE